MKAKFFVSLTSALALMIFSLNGAHAVGPGKTCGGFLGLQCHAGLFCQFKAGTCGFFDVNRTCTKKPRFCSRIFRPVCGCDGKTYGNDCSRQSAGVQLNHAGEC